MRTTSAFNQTSTKPVQNDFRNSWKQQSIIRLMLFVILTCLTVISSRADGLDDLFNTDNVEKAQKDFLKVDQAFTVVPMQQGHKVIISMEITPEHYLYKDKISLKLPEGVTATPLKFSKSSHSISDPIFGQVAVFDQNQVTATSTLNNTTARPIAENITLTWQGCAKAGLCYPPQKQQFKLKLAAPDNITSKQAKPVSTVVTPAKDTSTDGGKRPSTSSSENTLAKNVANKTDTGTSKTVTSTNEEVVAPVKKEEAKHQTSNKGEAVALPSNSEDKSRKAAVVGESVGTDDTEVAEGTQTDGAINETYQVEGTLPTSEGENKDSYSDTAVSTSDGIADDSTVNHGTSSNSALGSGDILGTQSAIEQDPFGLGQRPWLGLILLFLAGVGLAFTPCVLPMLPIVSNIVARQHKPTAKGGLILSGSYAIGVATAYGILGAIIAVFGQSLGVIGWLQNPIILLTFAIIFILLALYMLDAFVLPVPNKIKQKLQSISQVGDSRLGSWTGSFIVGFLSALVVSPCVSAPLFGALLAVSTIGSPLLGFAALFMLGLGLSAPLVLLGVSQGNLMPKAGAWMNWIKQGFALLLFAVALLLIARMLISPAMLILWALWFVVVAMWLWSWDKRGQLLTKPAAILLLMWSAITLVGAAAGSRDVSQPLDVFKQAKLLDSRLETSNVTELASINGSSSHPDIWITSLDELIPIIKENKKVLVDVTAEWCVECRIMDKTLFTNRPQELQDWQIVKLDITESNEDSSQVLSELKLFGPPALLYFVDGKLQLQQVGNIERTAFEQTLIEL